MLHWLPPHAGVPWVELQAVPQAPQLAVLVAMLVSHPSRLTFSFALQFANPALHAMLHTPAAQVGVPLATLQACPHPPQLPTVVLVLISQPLPRFPSQLAKPALQTNWQAPSVQAVAVMLAGAWAEHT
jgi:hypothetical protein